MDHSSAPAARRVRGRVPWVKSQWKLGACLGQLSLEINTLALTRKNALFAGSDGGAEHWAVIASLIETCKLTGIEPHGYLTDVITRIVNAHPQSRLDELLPWAYPTTQALRAVA